MPSKGLLNFVQDMPNTEDSIIRDCKDYDLFQMPPKSSRLLTILRLIINFVHEYVDENGENLKAQLRLVGTGNSTEIENVC